MLHDRRSARRAARRRRASASPTTSSTSSAQFAETVISNFVREYAAGRTPIPCVHCNGDLKFATLAERAEAFGAESCRDRPLRARRARRRTGRYRLKRGVDPAEGPVVLPLHADAGAARARACSRSASSTRPPCASTRASSGCRWPRSRTATRSASSPTATTPAFLERHGAAVPAPATFANVDGHVVGRHDGVHRFTVGQRKGLGLSSPDPALRRRHRRGRAVGHRRPAGGARARRADGVAA